MSSPRRTRDTSIRFSELSHFELDREVASLLPADFCLERGVVVLGPAPSPGNSAVVPIGMISARDKDLVEEVKQRLGFRVRPVQLNAFEVRSAIGRIYGLAFADEPGEVPILHSGRSIGFSPDQSPRTMLDDLLSTAINRSASDIHIEVYRRDVDLRLRIDGVLQQITTPLDPDNVIKVVSRLKVLCSMDLIERRRPLDGRFAALYKDGKARRRIDFRVSVVPGPYGQDAVLRILDPERFFLDLDSLAMEPALLKRYLRLINRPGGLLLTCGPTNSGKTTTLYASIQTLLKRNLKIVTVEEPVEYEFPKVNQKNVTETAGFAEYLRAFLRQNPDVILVGEIRDTDTAENAIRAATTGHLLLSTLHTNDAIGAIARLRTLGVPDDHLSEVLIGSLGQRLVRRICEECRTEAAPPPEIAGLFYEGPPPGALSRGTGCDACEETGYRGRIGVYEMFEPDPNLRAQIAEGRPIDELRRTARAGGEEPLVEDALRKAERGLTTLEEIVRCIGPKYPKGSPGPGNR